MKHILFIFWLLPFALISNAQSVDEFGLMLTWDGKLEFYTGDQNYNGNLDDPIKIIHNGDTFTEDKRNVRYNSLSFLVGSDAPLPSNLDPCQNDYRTTSYGSEIDEWWGWPESIEAPVDKPMYTLDIFSTTFDTLFSGTSQEPGFNFYCDSAIFHATETQKYTDEINGCLTSGNYDSTHKVLKERLMRFIVENSGESYSRDDYRTLVKEISQEDSAYRVWVTEDSAKFVYFHDYLINSMDFYDYDGDKLVKIISYNYSSGVYQAHFEYDNMGNLIHLTKEHLDGQKEEFTFEYNRKKQVVSTTKRSTYFWGTKNEHSSIKTDLYDFKYNRKRQLIWMSQQFEDSAPREVNFVSFE